ncbi:hypothetical protein CWI75_10290 [Kineobactrum sediminis]|uniref:AsmA domain-containing protein n=1 Tax=Kineobactrum sediminis TaxID=1905677 RepID=A0A2N5Y191_9GAMM|nr:AsmA-like C-terminal region-containing protein [Kineobactrum sediminis]PLW82170.1 hypothetical protein CWI75_10290 [Kineobactrum sediminis]
MRAFLILPVVLLASLLAAGAVLLSTPALLVPTAQWAVARFTPMRLEVAGLELSLPALDLRAEALHLYQQDTQGPALFSMLDFRGSTTLRDLWQGNLLATDIRAASIVVYVDTDDTAPDPTPRQWLEYSRYLPRQTDIGSIHAIRSGEAVAIFPLVNLQGSRLAQGGFQVSAEVDHNGETHYVQLQTTALDEVGQRAGIIINATVEAANSDSRAELAGTITADARDLHYDLSLTAALKDVATLLEAFPGAPAVSGSLTLQGRLAGDRSGYQLTDSIVKLDNAPAYTFEASGSLRRQGHADPVLALVASGQMDSFEHLLRWLDFDVSPLGSVRASIALSGTPAAIAVDQLTIVSENSEGLWISLNGSSGAGSLGAARLPPESQFSLYVHAPSLAALNPWLAQPLTLDAGPGWLSATLLENQGQLRLQDIKGQLGRAEDILLNINGNIASIDLQTLSHPEAFKGINLDWDIASPDVAKAADSLQFELPAYLQVDGQRIEARGRLQYRQQQVDLLDLQASLQGQQTTATATGNIHDVTGHYQVKVRLDYTSTNSALLESLSGLPLEPVRGELNLTLNPLETLVAGTTRVGTTDISTQAALAHREGQVTSLSATIASPRVQLGDLGLQAETGVNASYRPVEQLDPVLERGSLRRALELVPRYPLDLRINLGALRGAATAFDALDIHITGEQNQYLLREFDFSYADARAEIRGIVDITLDPPRFSVAGQALSVPLSSLGQDLGLKQNISGTLNLRGGLSAGGLTAAELLTTLDGTLGIALEDATIEGAAYDVLASGLLNWLFSGAALRKSTSVDCVMAQFSVAQGIARTQDIFIESPNMIATGIGELDLPQKQMSLTLTPRSRLRTIQVPSSISLRGDMASPRTSISPVTATLDVYSEAMLFLPRLVLKIFGAGKPAETTEHPCKIMPVQ